MLSLLALALSAWVKWKPVAGALLFGVFFVAAGFGAAINDVLRTKWGHLINISHLIGSVWVAPVRGAPMRPWAPARVFFRVAPGEEIPLWCCWAALVVLCLRLPLPAGQKDPRRGGGAMSDGAIVFDNVSRFYGEVLGVNRVNLSIPPGVTSLVGPNGSGKTTLMNLMTGLHPADAGRDPRARHPAGRSRAAVPRLGYCTQFDAFPKGLTGYQFIYSYLRVLRHAGRRGATSAPGRRSSASA